jgi:hypothetical protein
MKFEFTPEGYQEAVRYLKRTNQYHKIASELSEDGYTVTALANDLWEKDTESQLIDDIVNITSEMHDLDYTK